MDSFKTISQSLMSIQTHRKRTSQNAIAKHRSFGNDKESKKMHNKKVKSFALLKVNQSEQCLQILKDKEHELRELNLQIQDKLKSIGKEINRKTDLSHAYSKERSSFMKQK